jgi:ABC-type transport system involved in multi-copper enzyme maturation permease subunit
MPPIVSTPSQPSAFSVKAGCPKLGTNVSTTLVPNNPILYRELTNRLRSGKTMVAILVVASISSLLVLMRWPSDATIDLVSQGAMQVFRPVAFAIAIAIMMLIPAFPATAIVTERQRGTLTLLLNSPLPTWKIYTGKLLGNVLLGIVLFSVSLPALFACYAMGGISIVGHILPLLLVFLAMTLQYSALGLFVSSQSSSADASLRSTYGAVLFFAVLSIGPSVLVGKLTGITAWLAQCMTTLSPIPALQQITGSQGQSQSIGLSTGWPQFLAMSFFSSALFAIATLFKLDPLLLDRARPAGKVIDGKKSGWLRRLSYLVDPQRRKAGIPFWLNPVMVKEFRTRKFGRLHWLLRLVAVGGIISLLLTVVAATGTVNWGVERIAASMVLMQIGFLLLLGPSLGANLIASEVESGGWQLLRASPISPLRIVVGKLLSTLLTLLLLLCATLPGYVMMSYIQPAVGGQVSNVIVSLVIATAMVTIISACVSAYSNSTAVATASSYAILLALFAGTLLIWLGRGSPFGPVLVEQVLLLNPAATALAEMKAPGFETYQLTPRGWYVGIAICVIGLVVLTWRTLRMTRPE